jgi:hypothetical protein
MVTRVEMGQDPPLILKPAYEKSGMAEMQGLTHILVPVENVLLGESSPPDNTSKSSILDGRNNHVGEYRLPGWLSQIRFAHEVLCHTMEMPPDPPPPRGRGRFESFAGFEAIENPLDLRPDLQKPAFVVVPCNPTDPTEER